VKGRRDHDTPCSSTNLLSNNPIMPLEEAGDIRLVPVRTRSDIDPGRQEPRPHPHRAEAVTEGLQQAPVWEQHLASRRHWRAHSRRVRRPRYSRGPSLSLLHRCSTSANSGDRTQLVPLPPSRQKPQMLLPRRESNDVPSYDASFAVFQHIRCRKIDKPFTHISRVSMSHAQRRI
jgi:hypothetical protein